MRCWLAALCFAMPLAVCAADETVAICYYGCLAHDDVQYSQAQLDEISRLMNAAVDAEEERNLGSRYWATLRLGYEQSHTRTTVAAITR